MPDSKVADSTKSNSPQGAPAGGPRVVPAPIIEMSFAFAQSSILLAAVELDICTHIAHGATTAAQLAAVTHSYEPYLRRLLDAMCAFGLLSFTGEGYQLTPVSEQFMVRDKASYIGDVALQTRREWDAWSHFTDVVRTGKSHRIIDEEPLGGEFFSPLADQLFPILYPIMKRICQKLGVGTQLQGLTIADLGAGTAPSSIAVLEQDPQAHALAVDFEAVLERAREFASKHGVESRMEYQVADMKTVELPAEQFDLVFASHLFRIIGEETTRRVIQQSFQALKPGGRLIVVESYKEPAQFDRSFPHIISLNMMVNTRSGDTFSSDQMLDLLSKAGFEVEVWPQMAPDVILVARKP